MENLERFPMGSIQVNYETFPVYVECLKGDIDGQKVEMYPVFVGITSIGCADTFEEAKFFAWAFLRGASWVSFEVGRMIHQKMFPDGVEVGSPENRDLIDTFSEVSSWVMIEDDK